MDFKRLEHYIDSLEAKGFRACDIEVRYKGEKVFRHSMGYSDSEGTKPVSNTDFYWMYSMSKVITCTAAMRFVERGELNLDDPLYKYLPEFENMNVATENGLVPAKNKILIHHLFSMRAGFTYELWSPSLTKARANKDATTREIISSLANEPLLFEPGTDYNYSLAHDVLAAVLEVIAGKTYYEILKEELFEPLGMKEIGFAPTAAQLERFSTRYIYDNELYRCTPSPRDISECDYRLSNNYESGGAGLFCTLDEYMKLVEALSLGGTAKNGYKVLSIDTINLMRTNRQTEKETPKMKLGYGYGLGVRTMMDKKVSKSLSSIGEFGWDGAACSCCIIDPDKQIGVVFTTHIRNCGIYYGNVFPYLRNMVYKCLGFE